MMTRFASTVALIAFAASPAFAEQRPSVQTQSFIEKAATANQFEIESSKLAMEKSSNSDVKSFAREMVRDHEKSHKDLKNYVDEANLDDDLIPSTLDARHAETLAQLKTAAGSAQFDQAYLKAQKEAHQESIRLFDEYANSGDNAEIRDYAAKTLPTLKKHQTHAQQLNAK